MPVPSSKKYVIKGRLTDLNEYTNACRSHWSNGAKRKQETEEYIAWQLTNKTTFTSKVFVTFHWYEKNRMRDKDNIAFAKKFILDAFVSQGILKGDGWAHVEGFKDCFYVDKKNPRVEVEITEIA